MTTSALPLPSAVAIIGDRDLPIIGDLLKGLPVVGDLVKGPPVVGDLVKGLPVVGGLVGDLL